MSDFVSQIINFRTAYLRAVARASVDLPFREELTNPKNDPMSILRKKCGYVGTWNLKLVIRDDPHLWPRVDPATSQVVGPGYLDEAITIFVPDRPVNVSVEEQMNRLAVLYFDANAWLLHGSSMDTSSLPPEPSTTTGVRPAVFPPRRANRYDLGDATSDFLSFVAALFNSIALAWTNPKFKELLIKKEVPPGHTVALLQEWIGYKYPWDLDLKIRIDKDARYIESSTSRNDRPAARWELRPPELKLTLPWMTGALDAKEEVKANLQNPGVAMMGLALYNTDGAGYPFTCGGQ